MARLEHWWRSEVQRIGIKRIPDFFLQLSLVLAMLLYILSIYCKTSLNYCADYLFHLLQYVLYVHIRSHVLHKFLIYVHQICSGTLNHQTIDALHFLVGDSKMQWCAVVDVTSIHIYPWLLMIFTSSKSLNQVVESFPGCPMQGSQVLFISVLEQLGIFLNQSQALIFAFLDQLKELFTVVELQNVCLFYCSLLKLLDS